MASIIRFVITSLTVTQIVTRHHRHSLDCLGQFAYENLWKILPWLGSSSVVVEQEA